MQRIDPGEPGCDPCRVQARTRGHLIRGDGDQPRDGTGDPSASSADPGGTDG
jgi:hypothetical protein